MSATSHACPLDCVCPAAVLGAAVDVCRAIENTSGTVPLDRTGDATAAAMEAYARAEADLRNFGRTDFSAGALRCRVRTRRIALRDE